MNSNELKPINLQTAFTLAENIAKTKSPKANFILNHSVDKSKREYLNLCFAYLRWVDDFIDDPKTGVSKKEIFIERQKYLFGKYVKKEFVEYNTSEEAFLFYFLKYAAENRFDFIIDAVESMIDAITMDVERLKQDGIFSAKELETYVNKQSKALYDIIIFFFIPNQYNEIKHIHQGRFQAKAFIMRDLIEDIDAGFINISREDIQKYNLELQQIKDKKNLEPWIKEEIKKILELLISEAKVANTLPLKYRIFVYYSHIYYLPKVYRLKFYKYNPALVLESRSVFKELQTYLLSFWLGMKLFAIEFI